VLGHVFLIFPTYIFLHWQRSKVCAFCFRFGSYLALGQNAGTVVMWPASGSQGEQLESQSLHGFHISVPCFCYCYCFCCCFWVWLRLFFLSCVRNCTRSRLSFLVSFGCSLSTFESYVCLCLFIELGRLSLGSELNCHTFFLLLRLFMTATETGLKRPKHSKLWPVSQGSRWPNLAEYFLLGITVQGCWLPEYSQFLTSQTVITDVPVTL